MPKILLLGATGFIGSNIAKELDRQGRTWRGVARKRRSGNSRICTLDNKEELYSILEDRPIVINALGGLKPPDYVQRFEAAMGEFWQGTNDVLAILREVPPLAILQISSAGTVYGEAPGRPSKECDPPAPVSWYGRMKVVEEALYHKLAHDLGVSYVCARVTNPFGNRNHPTHGFVDVLIDHVKRGRPFYSRFRPGACRDFIYAPDMAKAIIAMIDKPADGVFNIGSGKSTPLAELVDTVRAQVPGAQIRRSLSDISDVVNSSVSTERYTRTYGSCPVEISVLEYLQSKLKQLET